MNLFIVGEWGGERPCGGVMVIHLLAPNTALRAEGTIIWY
jgi:hypothetical protein